MKILESFKNLKIVSELRRGLEREALRVTPSGHISEKPHPEALGSALTNPYITTDYSEALLEFVTPVYSDPKELLMFLKDLHIFTLKRMGDEVLWTNSMPCLLKKEDAIPIANYGSSNIGQMKTVYRRGLKHRYGSAMQAISGIHFNFSLSDEFFKNYQSICQDNADFQEFKSAAYMNATRNIHRYSWLIPFIFGSSPAICRSFLNKAPKDFGLKEFDEKGSLYFEGATSLRLSNLGYTNSEQGKINICYNNINSYAKGLREAITTSEPRYENIGIQEGGNYKQLNSNILQIENEYYSGVRPKRITKSGESPTNALLKRGVEYIELRSVDVNAFSPIGIELDQVYFLDLFLTYCVLKEQGHLSPEVTKRFRNNQELVARHGRKKNLNLFNGSEYVSAEDWAKKTFKDLRSIAEQFDGELGSNDYCEALDKFYHSIDNTQTLYSERILNEMKGNEETFFRYTLNKSSAVANELKGQELSHEVEEMLIKTATTSLEKQKEIETADKVDFTTFLSDYLKQNTNS